MNIPRPYLRRPARRAALYQQGLCLAMVWTLCLLSPRPVAAADREAGLARLVGVWQLDQSVSEDPHRMLRQLERGYVPPEGVKEDPLTTFRQRAAMVTEGSNVLTIAYREGEVTLTDWNDAVQTLHVDGKKWSAERNGVAVVVEAEWKSSDRLLVKTTGAPGGWIRETYELGERGNQLFLSVELQRAGSKRSFAFSRLYNRAGGRQ